MSREELIEEILRLTGIDNITLCSLSNQELEEIYTERVLDRGML